MVADVVYKLCDGASDGSDKVSLIVSCGNGGQQYTSTYIRYVGRYLRYRYVNYGYLRELMLIV